MKRKFIYLMEFLKQFDCDKITQTYTFYDSGYDWGLQELGCEKSNDTKYIATPKVLYGLLDDILNHMVEEIESEVYNYNDDISRFDVNVEIYPKKGLLVYSNADIRSYSKEGETHEYEFDEQDEDDNIVNKCREFLESLGNPESVTISYDGSGDSGSLEQNGITSDGRNVDLPSDIEDICYHQLEEFYGWEINEGSSGEIIITNDSLTVDHYWNREEWDNVGLDIGVTADSLD
jgi:hypothetical protein